MADRFLRRAGRKLCRCQRRLALGCGESACGCCAPCCAAGGIIAPMAHNCPCVCGGVGGTCLALPRFSMKFRGRIIHDPSVFNVIYPFDVDEPVRPLALPPGTVPIVSGPGACSGSFTADRQRLSDQFGSNQRIELGPGVPFGTAHAYTAARVSFGGGQGRFMDETGWPTATPTFPNYQNVTPFSATQGGGSFFPNPPVQVGSASPTGTSVQFAIIFGYADQISGGGQFTTRAIFSFFYSYDTGFSGWRAHYAWHGFPAPPQPFMSMLPVTFPAMFGNGRPRAWAATGLPSFPAVALRNAQPYYDQVEIDSFEFRIDEGVCGCPGGDSPCPGCGGNVQAGDILP